MGIDLGDVVVRRPVTLQHFAGKRVAFDAWNILYQFLSSIRGPDGTPLMDKDGNITSHLNGVLFRTAALAEVGIKPVFVFDGTPPELKRETLAARAARKQKAQGEHDEAKARHAAAVEAGDEAAAESAQGEMRTKAQQTSRLTVPMAQEAMELLRHLGIPVVQAPGEGEAQGAWMVTHGLVDAVVTQDFDALLFGTPVLARHLATGGRRKLPGKQVWADVAPEEIPLAESLAHLGCDPRTCAAKGADAASARPEHAPMTYDQLIDVALLVGTDFHPGILGIGAKKAIQLVRKDGSLEALLDRLEGAAADERAAKALGATERAVLEQHEALADRDAVRRIFTQSPHTDVDPAELAMRPPDAGAVRELMVRRHGFNAERVDAALAKLGSARGKASQARLF